MTTKQKLNRYRTALVLLSFCLASLSRADCTQSDVVALVVSVQGELAVAQKTANTSASLNRGDALKEGDSVVVGSYGRAAIYFCATRSVIRLDSDSVLMVRSVSVKHTFLELLKGALYFFSHYPQSLELTTPFVNAGVEGTEFVIRIAQDTTELNVINGIVTAENEFGRLRLTPGQSSIVARGQAPARKVKVQLEDAVAWALYYQPIILAETLVSSDKNIRNFGYALARNDIAEALDLLDELSASLSRVEVDSLRAGLRLTTGHTEEGQAELVDNFDNALSIALWLTWKLSKTQTVLERESLLLQSEELSRRYPGSPAISIARSYVAQANFNLVDALKYVDEALKLSPENYLAYARLAELNLSMGNFQEALTAATAANASGQSISRSRTILGFAHLKLSRLQAAMEEFESAVQLDQTDPLPRLGLGLINIRRGFPDIGRLELEVAVSLDPANALLRSYLGKAYHDGKDATSATEELEIAAKLDANDPTAYFYLALLQHVNNRPIDALSSLHASIEKNGNRAVYRSKLLLDSDLAARGASLARIYQDLGFDRIAQLEASKSLSVDPSNHSAHRFLSEAYASYPRHEVARVSELLQSQLLQPVNVYPASPSFGVSDLNSQVNGTAFVSGFNEFSSLFESDRTRIAANGYVGNNSEWGEEVIVSTVSNNISASAGQLRSDTDGYRVNNDVRNDVNELFVQAAIGPKLNVQGQYRRRDSRYGDLVQNFDLDDILPNARSSIDQDLYRLGIRYSPSVSEDFIGSAFYVDDARANDDFDDISSFKTNVNTDGHQIELQFQKRLRRRHFVSGIGTTDLTSDRYVQDVFESFVDEVQEKFDRKHHTLYSYHTSKMSESFNWTIGFSYEDYADSPIAFNRFNPKLGFEWMPGASLRVRGAAFRSVKKTLVADQSIEPTSIAGFNQLYDDFNGTRFERYGVGIDYRLNPRAYVGFELSARDLSVPGLQFNEFDELEAYYEK